MPSPSSDLPRLPRPAAGFILFFGFVVAGVVVAQVLPPGAAQLAIPALMVLATGLAVIAFKVDAKETLLLRLPGATDFLMAIPLTISFYILDDQIAALSHASFPVPEDTLDEFRRLLTAETPRQWVEKIALIGVGAAVSEELMFRGFMLSAFLQRLRRPAAIVLSAALFMGLHPQFLPVLAAGIVLGYVALATRSIVVPIFVHFCNNVIQLLLFNLAGLETLGDPVWIPPTILVPALVMFALSCGYYLRDLEPEPEPSSEPRREIDSESPAADQSDRLNIPHDPRPLGDELSAVPAGRRRLGWLVVAGAMAGGVLVLLGLFGWSMYYANPERMHVSAIDVLERRVTDSLEPEALDAAPDIASAFRALTALNESGQLDGVDLVALTRTYLELSADGGLDREDADAFIETIRVMVMERTTPRAL